MCKVGRKPCFKLIELLEHPLMLLVAHSVCGQVGYLPPGATTKVSLDW